MSTSNGYALDMWSPARHVASEMERAAPVALSTQVLAETYRHPIPSDLVRVQMHEGCSTDDEAVRWLIGQVIGELRQRGKSGAVQLVEEDGGFRFADGVTFDDLRFRGKKLVRTGDDPIPIFGEPFDPNTDAWNRDWQIRSARLDPRDSSLDELRESMRHHGWIKQFPALVTEQGAVIAGLRRMAIAKELGIEPVTQVVRLGKGDAADAERLRIAIASNVGRKPLTPRERQQIASRLYLDGWTQEGIADALNVHTDTISSDLRFSDIRKSTARGRPRKYTEDEEREYGRLVLDEGIPQHTAERMVRPDEPEREWPTKAALNALNRERGRRLEREQTQVDSVQGELHRCPTCGYEHPVQAP